MSGASSDDRPKHDSQGLQSKPNWGPAAAIIYTVFLYFGGQFLAVLAFSVLTALTGLSDALRGDGSGGIASQFYFVVFSDAIMLLGLWLFLRSRSNDFRQLGFGRKPVVNDLGYAIAGYAVYFGLFFIVLQILGPLTGINVEQKQELGFNNLLSQADKIMGFVALVLLPPVVEESIFRGFLFTGLRKKMTFLWAALITSLLFAGPHLLESSGGLLWVGGADTFILSLVLCYLREKTGALWAGIAIHAVKNAIAFAILLTATR